MQPTIVKIGGSVLTRKKQASPIFRKSAALQIVLELQRYRKTSGDDLILIHGAGSFGHPLAKKYRIQHKNRNAKTVLGAIRTHLGVKQLNLLFAEVLARASIPIVSLPPLFFVAQNKGRITSFNTKIITDLLQEGILPLLHGDVVRDKSWGFSICSGDQIASFLASRLRTKRVLFATDVDGIAAQDPKKNRRPGFFKRLTKKQAALLVHSTVSSRSDVTGAMGGKLLEISKMRGKIIVFNGLRRGNLLAVLRGGSRGTLVA